MKPMRTIMSFFLVFVLSVVLINQNADTVFAAGTSRTISLNTTYTDNLATSNESDLFYFNLPNPGSFSVSMEKATAATGGWAVALYIKDNNGNWSSFFDVNLATNSNFERTTNYRLPKGSYYIKVYVKYNTYTSVNYKLTTHFTDESAGRFEREFNNSLNEATPITLNTQFTGNLHSSNDVDYYKLSLPENGLININFRNSQSTQAWKVYLYSIDQYNDLRWILNFDNGRTNSYTSDNYRLPKGNYIVKIDIGYNNWLGSDYQFTVNYTAQSDPLLYEQEFNDAINNANLIPVNKTITGNLSDTNDVDVYKVSLATRGKLSFTFKRLSESSCSYLVDVIYFDQVGNEVVWDRINAGNTVTTTYDSQRLPKNDYYFKVYRGYGTLCTQDYNLTVNFSSETSAKIESEFNGTQATAVPIQLGYTYTGNSNYSNDKDYYYFNATVKDTVYLSMTKSVADTGKWKLSFYKVNSDTSLSLIHSFVASSVGETKHGGFNILPGKYMILIEPSSSYSYDYTNKDYKFKVHANFFIPPNFTVNTNTYNSLKLTWSKVPMAAGYQVYRSTSKTGTYTLAKDITTNTNSFTNTSLTTGSTYYYKVRAYTVVDGKRVYSKFTTVVGKKVVPPVPANLVIDRTGIDRLKLSWTAVTGATGYEVYRSTSSTGTYKLVKDATVNYHTNTGLTLGKTYFYKIRAYRVVNDVKVYSSYTAVLSRKVLPPTPTGFTVTRVSSTSSKLSWNAVSGATGYQVYRSTSLDGTYSKVATVTGTTFTNSGLTAGKTYFYKVRAYTTNTTGTHYGGFSVTLSLKQ